MSCLLSGVLHHLPELSNNRQNMGVISQRLKANANFSKLKSKENTRHNSRAEGALCFLLEEHACVSTPTIRAVDMENTS